MSLYRNIQKKRARIKAGSGEKMRRKGAKGAPTKKQFIRAKKTAKKKRAQKMDIPSMNLNEMSFGFLEMLQPLMAITLAMVIALAVKDWATNLVAGLKFKWDEAWYEGQPCYVDGEPC